MKVKKKEKEKCNFSIPCNQTVSKDNVDLEIDRSDLYAL